MHWQELSTPSGRQTSEECNLPVGLRIALVATLISSGMVMFEPAPSDLFFFLALPLAFWYCKGSNFGWFGAVSKGGAFVLLTGTFISLAFALDLSSATLFISITIYMLLSWYAYSLVIAKYGMRAYRVMISAYLGSALITSFIAVLARFSLLPYSRLFWRDSTGFRIQSTFKDPNVLGPYIATAFILYFASVLRRRSMSILQRLSAFTVFFLFLATLLFAFSRGAFIHFGISISLFVVIHLLMIRDRDMTGRLVGFLAVGAVMATLTLPLMLTRLDLTKVLTQRSTLQKYDDDRFDAQSRAIKVAERNLMGIGPGQWTESNHTTEIHNVYLRVWTENGAISVTGLLLFYLGSLTTCLSGIVRRSAFSNEYAAVIAIVGGFLVNSCVIDSLHWRHIYLILAIGPGLAGFEAIGRPRLVRSRRLDPGGVSAIEKKRLSSLRPKLRV